MYATGERESQNERVIETTEVGIKEREEDQGRDHVKKMGQLVKDAAQVVKDMLFGDLDK